MLSICQCTISRLLDQEVQSSTTEYERLRQDFRRICHKKIRSEFGLKLYNNILKIDDMIVFE